MPQTKEPNQYHADCDACTIQELLMNIPPDHRPHIQPRLLKFYHEIRRGAASEILTGYLHIMSTKKPHEISPEDKEFQEKVAQLFSTPPIHELRHKGIIRTLRNLWIWARLPKHDSQNKIR